MKTGHISPQYHVVFDDTFSTVPSLADDEVPPTFWNELSLENELYSKHVHRVVLDDDSQVSLDPDFMTPVELEEHHRAMARRVEIRKSSLPPSSAGTPFDMPVPTETKESHPLPSQSKLPSSSPPRASSPPRGSTTNGLGLRRSTRANKGKIGVSFAEEVQSGA